MRRPLPYLVMLAVLALAAVSCGDDSTDATQSAPTAPASGEPSITETTSPAPVTAPAPSGDAVTTTLTLVDESRPTPAGTQTEALPTRTLETWLYVPEASGPVPLIVFSHGLNGHPLKFERMHTAWVDAGYAVAAPAFPLSNDTVPGAFGNVGDLPGQAGDVSFVLDELLTLTADPSSALAGRLDPDRVGAAGLSLGGATTYIAAVNEQTRDPRFAAAVIEAGLLLTSEEAFTAPVDLPVLILHGDADPLVGLDVAAGAYARLAPPKFFVTLLGGSHASPFEDEDAGAAFHDLVDGTTTRFWDAYLRPDPTADGDDVVAIASVPDLTRTESDLG